VTGTFILLFGWMGFNRARRLARRTSDLGHGGNPEPGGGLESARRLLSGISSSQADISMA
jgi:hypothetical protein